MKRMGTGATIFWTCCSRVDPRVWGAYNWASAMVCGGVITGRGQNGRNRDGILERMAQRRG